MPLNFLDLDDNSQALILDRVLQEKFFGNWSSLNRVSKHFRSLLQEPVFLPLKEKQRVHLIVRDLLEQLQKKSQIQKEIIWIKHQLQQRKLRTQTQSNANLTESNTSLEQIEDIDGVDTQEQENRLNMIQEAISKLQQQIRIDILRSLASTSDRTAAVNQIILMTYIKAFQNTSSKMQEDLIKGIFKPITVSTIVDTLIPHKEEAYSLEEIHAAIQRFDHLYRFIQTLPLRGVLEIPPYSFFSESVWLGNGTANDNHSNDDDTVVVDLSLSLAFIKRLESLKLHPQTLEDFTLRVCSAFAANNNTLALFYFEMQEFAGSCITQLLKDRQFFEKIMQPLMKDHSLIYVFMVLEDLFQNSTEKAEIKRLTRVILQHFLDTQQYEQGFFLLQFSVKTAGISETEIYLQMLEHFLLAIELKETEKAERYAATLARVNHFNLYNLFCNTDVLVSRQFTPAEIKTIVLAYARCCAATFGVHDLNSPIDFFVNRSQTNRTEESFTPCTLIEYWQGIVTENKLADQDQKEVMDIVYDMVLDLVIVGHLNKSRENVYEKVHTHLLFILPETLQNQALAERLVQRLTPEYFDNAKKRFLIYLQSLVKDNLDGVEDRNIHAQLTARLEGRESPRIEVAEGCTLL